MHPPRAAYLLWFVAGFVAWASAFVFLYAFHALGCAFGWSDGVLRLGLALILLVHLIVIGWMWLHLSRAHPELDSHSTGAFMHKVVVWATIAAFVTTVLSLGPALLLTACR